MIDPVIRFPRFTLRLKVLRGSLESDADYADRLAAYRALERQHNEMVQTNPFPNAGFDLFVPQSVVFDESRKQVVPHWVAAELFESLVHGPAYHSFLLYPRSSIHKQQLMLANSVGVIDAGYRGDLTAVLRFVGSTAPTECRLRQLDRVVQLCAPDLSLFWVEVLDETQSLYTPVTDRGEGGFGSTGK